MIAAAEIVTVAKLDGIRAGQMATGKSKQSMFQPQQTKHPSSLVTTHHKLAKAGVQEPRGRSETARDYKSRGVDLANAVLRLPYAFLSVMGARFD